jgi:hypothetical protein
MVLGIATTTKLRARDLLIEYSIIPEEKNRMDDA